uniref:Uncharacterized protein n=1 Tax=Arundo donax TaxID=35708 RepID=A0A0A9H5X3_ARUDO
MEIYSVFQEYPGSDKQISVFEYLFNLPSGILNKPAQHL